MTGQSNNYLSEGFDFTTLNSKLNQEEFMVLMPNHAVIEPVSRTYFYWQDLHSFGVTAEYPATLTALLKNHGCSVCSVWGNNFKCSKAVLEPGDAVGGTQTVTNQFRYINLTWFWG